MRFRGIKNKHKKSPTAGATDTQSSSSQKNRFGSRKNLLVLLPILVLVIFVGIRFIQSKNPPADNTAPTYGQTSDADQLASTPIPSDTSDTDRARYYKTIAASYSSTDTQKELEYLLKAEQLTPDDKDLLYNIAIAYQKLGDASKQATYEERAGKKVDTRPIGSSDCDISEEVCS